MSLSTHTVLRGKYGNYTVISDTKKGGGMAEIWDGKDDRGRAVIIKIAARKADGNDDIRVDKLKVETDILRELSNPSHPHIVKYIDECTHGNIPVLIMEKITGPTLKEQVVKNSLDERTALNYLSKILSAIDYVHKKNVIHRDMKPSNIIIDSQRGPVLIDFGAAKSGYTQMMSSQQSMTDMTRIGTPGWTCPEQDLEGKVDTACDIYGVGTITFYMLTGKEPRLFMDASRQIIKSPHELNSSISFTTSEMVKKAIDPHHRTFTTADDLISFLQGGGSAPPSFGRPHIILRGIKYELVDELDVGRKHDSCDANCHSLGFRTPPKISLIETGPSFISKHHIRIWKDRQGYYWIQDLRSRNGTAIYKNGSYRILTPGQKELLLDNSSVAICYNAVKGPYITFTFHER